jgi:hypothetical protein
MTKYQVALHYVQMLKNLLFITLDVKKYDQLTNSLAACVKASENVAKRPRSKLILFCGQKSSGLAIFANAPKLVFLPFI